jgi:hypothetical protein
MLYYAAMSRPWLPSRIGVSFLLINLAMSGLSAPSTGAAPAEPRLDVRRIRQQARSRLVLGSGSTAVEVILHAEDEKTEILEGDYCGGDKGSKEYSGNYRLIAVRKDGLVASVLYLGHRTFTQGRIDGAEEFRIPGTKHRLIAIYQYRGCNGDGVELYRIDEARQIRQVQFLNKDGVERRDVFAGPGGVETTDGQLGFCGYNNAVGGVFCDHFKFNGQDWLQTRSWLIQANPGEPVSISEARRALFEFLINLYHDRYETAAFYYGGSDDPAKPEEVSRKERAEILRQHCSTKWQTCALPQDIEFKPSDAVGVLEFEVSFLPLESKPFPAWPRSTFRLRRSGADFKVLDLPRPDNR